MFFPWKSKLGRSNFISGLVDSIRKDMQALHAVCTKAEMAQITKYSEIDILYHKYRSSAAMCNY